MFLILSQSDAFQKTFVRKVDLLHADDLGGLLYFPLCFGGSFDIGSDGEFSVNFKLVPLVELAYILGSEEGFLLGAINLGFDLLFSVDLGHSLKVHS
jgi:hypothetical protein